MDLKNVYIRKLATSRSQDPDRDGLFRLLTHCVETARKSGLLPAQSLESKRLAYASRLRDFSNRVQVSAQDRGFLIVPAPDTATTYSELKYGSDWFELEDDIDPIIVSKIFWGHRT